MANYIATENYKHYSFENNYEFISIQEGQLDVDKGENMASQAAGNCYNNRLLNYIKQN